MAKSETADIILNIEISYDDAIKKIGDAQRLIKGLKSDQAGLKEELKAGKISNAEYTRAMNESNIAIKEAQSDIRVLTKEVQNNMKAQNAEKGSLVAMRAELINMKKAYGDLSEADRENIEIGGVMLKQTTELNNKIKETEAAYGDNQRKVGDYEIASKSLRGEIRELTYQLAEMALAGEKNSPAYQELAQKAGDLRDAVSDVNQETTARSSDTYMFDTITEGVKGVTAAYGLWQSASVALGIENEDLDKTMQQLLAATTALSSLTEIQNLLQKQSNTYRAANNLLMKVGINRTARATKAEVAFNVVKGKGSIATKAVATATWLWNAALAANPVVLIAVAVAALIGGIVALTKAFGSSAKAQKAATAASEAYEKQAQKTATTIDRINNDEKNISNERNNRLREDILEMQKNGATAEEIAKARAKTEQEQRDIAIQASDARIASIEKEIDTSRVNLNAQIAYLNTLRDGGKKHKEQQKVVDELRQSYLQLIQTKKDEQQTIDDLTLQSQESLQQQNEDVKKAQEQRSKDIAAARQKELEAIRAAQDAAMALIADNQERELQIARVGSERQIAELQKRLQTEKDLTKVAREAIKQQILSIEEKTRQDIEAINKKYSDAELQRMIADEQAKIELRLLKAHEGSDEEFNARREQLNMQMQQELAATESQMQQELATTEQIENQKALIREKYQQQITENDTLQQQTRDSLRAQALQNELDIQLQKLGENEVAKAQLILEHERTLNEQLQAMDAETKAKQYSSDEAYTAEVIASNQRIIDAEKAVQDASLKTLQDKLSNASALSGAIGDVLTSIGGDSEEYAEFQKALAMFNIAINTASAIAGAVSAATPGDPYSVAIRIAAAVASAIAGMAAASAAAKKAKEPKAPKFAAGGLVTGGGSGTSDSIPARLSNGESVMTALATQMFAPVLSPLNQIGGGVPIIVQETAAATMGEEVLEGIFTRALRKMPRQYVAVTDIRQVEAGINVIETGNNTK